MRQRPHVAARAASAPPFMSMKESEQQGNEALRSAEWGRKAILAGWLAATLGIVGYVYVLIRAGEETGVLAALAQAGPIGWLSVLLLVGGVGIWLAGNLALMRALVESDPDDVEVPPQY